MAEQVDINTQVSPGLHTDNVTALKDYEAHRPYLAGVLESFSTAYEGLSNIHKMRLATERNPTMNSAGKLLTVAKYAEQQQTVISKKVDKTLSDLNSGIEAMESMLNTPLKAAAGGSGTIPNEIRAHTKSLSLTNRAKFLSDAQANGDTQTLSAILGAPGYLSGISEAEKAARTRQYHEHKSPETVQRLELMKKGRDLLVERSALVFNEVQKAMGSPWTEVQKIRKAKSASDSFAIEGV